MPPHRRTAGLFLLLASPLAQVGGWKSLGPPLYQVNAVAAAPDADSTVYAGASIYEASQSAVFRSTDGGDTWRALTEAPAGEFYTEIAVDPGHPERIFVGALAGGAAKVYRSLDSGVSWSLSLTVTSVCSPSLAAGTAPDMVLLSCGTRVLRSQDAGQSWAELQSPFTEPTRLTKGPGESLYAYGSTRIFRSTSGGTSWSPAADAPEGCPSMLAFRVDPQSADVFLAGTGLLEAGSFQCGGVFQSPNAGATWTETTLTDVYVTDLAVDASNHTVVYASAGYLGNLLPRGGVYQSLDGGGSWTSLGLPALGASRLALSPSGRLLHAATSIGVFTQGFRKTRIVAPRAD